MIKLLKLLWRKIRVAIDYTPNSPTGGTYTALQIKAELDKIKAALAKAVDRYGSSPNQMESALDLNSNRIINLAEAVSGSDAVTLAQAERILKQTIVSGGLVPSELDEVLQTLTYRTESQIQTMIDEAVGEEVEYFTESDADLLYLPIDTEIPEAVPVHTKVQRAWVPQNNAAATAPIYHITDQALKDGNTFIFALDTAPGNQQSVVKLSISLGNTDERHRDVTVIVSANTGGANDPNAGIRLAFNVNNQSVHIGDSQEVLSMVEQTGVYTFRTINGGTSWFIADTRQIEVSWDTLTSFNALFSEIIDGDRAGGHFTNEFTQSEPYAGSFEWEGLEAGLLPYFGIVPWGPLLKNSSGYKLPIGLATLTRTNSNNTSYHVYEGHIDNDPWFFSAYVWLGNSPLTRTTLNYEDDFRLQYSDGTNLSYTDILPANILSTQVLATGMPDVYRVVVQCDIPLSLTTEIGLRSGLYAANAGEETVWNGYGFAYEDTGKFYLGTDV